MIDQLDSVDMETILQPTKIYVKNILEIQDVVKGVAHITGGGILKNLPRILNGHNFVLNKWKWPNIFQKLQQLTQLTDEEMLSTFNCGVGMVVVVDSCIQLPDKYFEIGSIS